MTSWLVPESQPATLMCTSSSSRMRISRGVEREDLLAPQQFRREVKGSSDVGFGQGRVRFENLACGLSGFQKLQDRCDHDPGSLETRFSVADVSFRGDVLFNLHLLESSRWPKDSTYPAAGEGLPEPARRDARRPGVRSIVGARRLELEGERNCFGDSSGRASACASSEDTFPVPIRQAATRKARSKRNSATTSPFPLLLRFFQRAAKTSRDSNHCHRTPQSQLYHLRELQEKFTGKSGNKDDLQQIKQCPSDQFTPEVGENHRKHEIKIPYNTNYLIYINNQGLLLKGGFYVRSDI